MPNLSKDIIAMEKRFWQSVVDEDTETALDMLAEPSTMVSSHGAMQFSHDDYKQMAENGSMVVKAYELSDMKVDFPTDDMAVLTYHAKQTVSSRGQSDDKQQEMADSSVWVRKDGQWRCVMHTETPVDQQQH